MLFGSFLHYSGKLELKPTNPSVALDNYLDVL